jgi:hypothetical protein
LGRIVQFALKKAKIAYLGFKYSVWVIQLLGGSMPVDWNEIQSVLKPIKDFEDLSRRGREAFAYPFVRKAYNFSMPGIADYTRLLLGGDPQARYTDYEARLNKTFNQLRLAGVGELISLVSHTDTRGQFEMFVDQSGIAAKELIITLKYLAYWVIPSKKRLSGLVQDGSQENAAIQILREMGIPFNLDILEQGITSQARMTLAETSNLPEATISRLVNRADFSRLPWASKATISNIIGAGYDSLAKLAIADPQKLYEDFFHYAKSIGKNLKFGNEIENSHRIAKILPVVLCEE